MSLLAFTLQVLPVSALALGAMFLGIKLLSGLVSVPWQLPLFLIGVLLFVAMLTFRRVRVWNLILLLTLALVAGALLGLVFDVGYVSWGSVLGLTCALLVLAIALGTILRGRLRWLGRVLWLLAWLYLAGWLLIVIWNPATWMRLTWAVSGVIFFSGLALVWFSELEGKHNPAGSLAVPEGCELYLLGLNIAIALRVLVGMVPLA
ncbi:MAG: hypothetical protein PVI78_10260 [Anaerolineales bacterium]|jgi:hypothetical protein